MITFTQFLKVTFFLFSFIVFTSAVYGQPAELQYHIEPYHLESGYHDGTGELGGSPIMVFSGQVQLHNIPWLQLHFSAANLGRQSYVLIKSDLTEHPQKLDATSIKQWNYFSAFFNGEQVEIELYAGPMDKNIFIKVDEVVVGEWGSGGIIESQCGPTDDRMLSYDPAVSRLLNVGCTSWIIPNGKIVSAGHCVANSGSVNIIEFNVPLSLPGGGLQHPGPEDQYAANTSTIVYVNGGIGNDWGVFEVYPNSVTGLMPKQAQNAYFTLVQDLGPDSIRITGHGVDGGTYNQVQQTHVGPNWGSSGTTMRYRTDTEGGNSGSPVIDALTHFATGVHTHGGCTSTGGNNNGTSFFNTAFWTAVDEGAGGCPVGLPSNPNPANGQTGVPLALSELTWSNGTGTVTTELYFGTSPGSLTLVQSGSLDSSWTITGYTLTYGTNYYWQVVEVGDTCSTNGAVWSFKTVLDPNIVIDTVCIYPQSSNYWTGTCNSSSKTQVSLVNAIGTELGWMVFDLSPIPLDATIDAITFNGYLYANNWPYWSITPMGTVDPRTGTASAIYNQVSNNYQQGVAYSFNQEPGTLPIGWLSRDFESTATADMQSALAQGWFAIGVVDWDFSTTYYVEFEGWAQTNIPYLCVVYEYLIPVELASFTAKAGEGSVELSWITSTETNNQGFEIERNSGNGFETIAFVSGHGTTTEVQAYSFSDRINNPGSYSYKLKQIDYDGTFTYSDVVNVDVASPTDYVLEQNYPNPFNPTTNIKIALPVKTQLQLNVYNALGERVAQVFSGTLEEGYHEFVFDASELSSGVYIYRIESDNFVAAKKMAILK